MKPDTSLKRVVAITLFCLIIFPLAQHTYSHYRALYHNQTQMAATEVFSQIAFVKSQLVTHMMQSDQWPDSIAVLNHTKNQFSVDFDLSQPGILHATIKNNFYQKELQNKSITYRFDHASKRFTCLPETSEIPSTFLPGSCGGNLYNSSGFSAKTWSLLVACGAIFIIIMLAVFNHTSLKLFRKNQYKINQHPSNELKKLHHLTTLMGQRQNLLKQNSLTKKHWQFLTHLEAERPSDVIKLLQKTLPIQSVQTVQKSLYRLGLSIQFPLSLSDFNTLIPANSSIEQISNKANSLTHDAAALLIIELNPENNRQLRMYRSQLPGNCVIPNLQQITQLLLPEFAEQCFIDLLVAHLPASLLSPYQGKGGVVKPSHFYGRQAILEKLQAKRDNNFFLVGGRQLGKTSILKALHRELSKNPNNLCIYLSLSDEQLLPRLAFHTQLEHSNNLVELITTLASQNPNKHIRILIDEADRFVMSEAQNEYPLLNQIRQCTDQGLCQFVFVGFWELFAHAILDYHAPIRNFAETITVGALESDAARQLIRQPMGMLKQTIDHEETVDLIIAQTGGRANLINLVCEFLITQVTEHPRIIDTNLVHKALQSQTVHDALQGWSNLTHNKTASGLDRMLVYLAFIYDGVDLERISKHLQQHQMRPEPETIKQSLQRLILAHIFSKHDSSYEFAVPLFAQQFSIEEAEILLQQETRLQLDNMSSL